MMMEHNPVHEAASSNNPWLASVPTSEKDNNYTVKSFLWLEKKNTEISTSNLCKHIKVSCLYFSSLCLRRAQELSAWTPLEVH